MDLVNVFMNVFSITEITPIIEVLKLKNVNSVYSFTCNHQDRMSIHKMFNCNNIPAATLDVAYEDSVKIPYSFNRIGIFVQTCDNWTQVLDHLSQNVGFKQQFKWLILTDDLSTTANILSNYTIEIDSDVTIIIKSNETNTFEFYEVFHTDYSKGQFYIKKVGYWNTSLHMNLVPRWDLRGVVMRCPVVVTEKIKHETFEGYLNKPKTTQVDSLHKLKFFSLLNYIRDMYNFSYDFKRTNSWGYFRNGSFDGIAGALQRKEADVGGSSLFFRADRAVLIDYIAETWPSRQCFILRHPKHPGGVLTIYTRPLDGAVWCCMLGMLAVSGFILYLTLRTETPTLAADTDHSFSLALLFHWSAVCQQGMSVNRSSASVKIVVFVTFVYAVTLYQYYNAMVVSTLLQEPPKNIRTLDDLIRSNLKAGAENVLYTKDFFKRTTDPVAQRMYHTRIAPAGQYNFLTAERGMALVKKGGYAFHVDSVVAYRIMRSTFTEREICEEHEILLYPPQKMGIVVQKSSPYKEHFTYGVRRLTESGVTRRLQALWDEPKPRCVVAAGARRVSLRECSASLLALVAGALAAHAVLVAEIFMHKWGKRIPFTL